MADMNTRWSEQSIYLLRTTQQHHVQLSLMADQKANMLIGAAFVVLSIAISQARTGLELGIPMVILGISAAISALLAALAVIPSWGAGKGQSAESANLLFFGAFRDLSEEEYLSRLSAQMTDDDSVYRAMVRDVHQMGQVLARKKYRYLRLAYMVFITGVLATVIAFGVDALPG